MKTDAQRIVEAVQFLEARGFIVIDIGAPINRAITTAVQRATAKAATPREREFPKTMRVAEARFLLGCSRSAFYKYARDDSTFPKGKRIGPRTVIWDRDELLAWLASQPNRGEE